MSAVIIGIDPHKASHTAVALDRSEAVLGQVRVRSKTSQVQQLLAWAASWPDRVWAVEGAAGLGYLLSQQLVDAGETVLDVQPKLAAKVRLLDTGSTNKNDPNDARSIAIAALRAKGLPVVRREDHVEVLKIWVRRRRELQRTNNRIANRLHAVLLELVPGGFTGEISPVKAERILDKVQPIDAVTAARVELATEILEDLRRNNRQRRELVKRIAQVVAATGTSVTGIYGVGPVVAAMVVGITGDINRIKSIEHFAAYNGTAPVEVSSGPQKIYRLSMRGNRQLNHAIHIAAVSQIRHRNNPGRVYYDRKLAEGKSSKMALRALKRQISNALYRAMVADAKKRAVRDVQGPGGQSGNGSDSSATGSHPEHQLFGQATPGPAKSLRPTNTAATRQSTPRRKVTAKKALDSKEASISRSPPYHWRLANPPGNRRSARIRAARWSRGTQSRRSACLPGSQPPGARRARIRHSESHEGGGREPVGASGRPREGEGARLNRRCDCHPCDRLRKVQQPRTTPIRPAGARAPKLLLHGERETAP